jgi:tetratricopeptide (TPR) repeat protein
MVRGWYQATLAYQQGKEQLDPGHTDRALALFPKDADILFFAACLHETFAAPAAHDALRVMTVPSGLRLELGSAEGELRLAERMFREALNERPDLVEARIRFGRVLGANGRHEDAARELRRAASEAADPLLLYYANLFAGAEEATLNRIDSARAAYQRASALFPQAQSPYLALSLLARRANDREAARQTIERVLAPPELDERDDPWWRYHTVQGRTVDERLDALRRLVPN